MNLRRVATLATIGALVALVPSASAKTVKLSLWTLFGSGAYYDGLKNGIDTYEKKHPGVKIDLLVYGDITEKLKVATAGGMGPDLVLVNGGVIEAWNMQFMLKPLNAYMKQAKLDNAYLPGPVDLVTRGGKTYGLPWVVDANFPIVYNRDAVAEVGLPDRAPRTPEETIEFDQKVQKKDAASGKVTRAGLIPWDWFANALPNWAWAFGPGDLGDGEHYTLTGPNAGKALDFYAKTGGLLGGAKAIEDFIAPIRWNNFTMKKWVARAMVVSMIQGALKTDKTMRFGVGTFPTTPQGVPAVWLGGHWLGVGSMCKHPQEAFDFASWFTTDLETQKQNRDGWFSGLKKAYDQHIYDAGSRTDPMAPILEFASTLVPQAHPYKQGIIDGGTLIEKAITDSVIKQTMTPAQAIAQANTNLNKLIDAKITRTGGRVKK